MKKFKSKIGLSAGLLTAFILWTIAVCRVDVKPVGPLGSCVGFAAMNQYVHNLTGVHLALYVLTDWLGLVPIGVCMAFAVLGLTQWIKRKSLWKVDRSIFVLGWFYVVTLAVFVLFEVFVVNYRPVLMDGILEASYPSSTTLLVMCVMPTAIMQLDVRVKNNGLRRCAKFTISVFIVFMVIGRLISGVHWVTDIIGGILLSAGLVMLYDSFSGLDVSAVTE